MKKTASQPPSPFHSKAFIANDDDGGNRSPLPEFEAVFLKRVDRLAPRPPSDRLALPLTFHEGAAPMPVTDLAQNDIAMPSIAIGLRAQPH
jgi:hypothetical protein